GGLLLFVHWWITTPVWHIDAVEKRRSPSHCFRWKADVGEGLLNTESGRATVGGVPHTEQRGMCRNNRPCYVFLSSIAITIPNAIS
ncbi:MAG: hypothetical protein O7D86_09530, partial [Proteobacteria bacterium]|nr:hypothetical protein [Pseudomonadota bacterium]